MKSTFFLNDKMGWKLEPPTLLVLETFAFLIHLPPLLLPQEPELGIRLAFTFAQTDGM
jgi:hypothetical protein